MQDKEPYAPDGTWIHIEEGHAPYIPIHGVNAEAYFPDVLRLPRGGLELGWRTGDEGTDGPLPHNLARYLHATRCGAC